jgi:membrane-associated protease RseP (regulator of RpoE activity)
MGLSFRAWPGIQLFQVVLDPGFRPGDAFWGLLTKSSNSNREKVAAGGFRFPLSPLSVAQSAKEWYFSIQTRDHKV